VADSAGQQFVWSASATGAAQVCRDAAGELAHAAYVTWLQLEGQADRVRIYENVNAQPRAFIVPHIEQVSAEDVITRLLSTDFDWRHSALLTQALPPEQAAQLSDTPARAPSRVNVTDYRLNSVDVEVETPAAGLLVMSDAYYPGWEAQLDGQPVPLYQTNGVMRGVFVPSGAHHVRFQFNPPLLRVGGILAALSLLAIGGILAVQMWRNRKARRPRS
jgi:hypothetical protein